MQQCRVCKEKKDFSNFHKDKSKPNGYGKICKKCYSEWHKKYLKTQKGKETNRKRVRNWVKSHPEKKRENTRIYRKENPEKIKLYKKIRRNREKNSTGFHTKGEWELLKKQYRFTCPSCGRQEPSIKLTKDHIIPFSKGGGNVIENIQPLCINCNCSKNTKVIQYSVF